MFLMKQHNNLLNGLTLKSRMSLREDIVLIAIERKNKLLSTKATVFRNEDSQGGSAMEKKLC
jgi:hypothetical protein